MCFGISNSFVTGEIVIPVEWNDRIPSCKPNVYIASEHASSHEVSVPRHRLSTYGRRAFAVAGPTVWNSLPEDMHDPDVAEDSYRQSLKTFLFSQY